LINISRLTLATVTRSIVRDWVRVDRIAKMVLTGFLCCVSVSGPVIAKKPSIADETAVRALIKNVYAVYQKQPTEPGSEMAVLQHTKSLQILVEHWQSKLTNGEVTTLSDFDWFCQCQDWDAKTAHIESQTYVVRGHDKIDANVRFIAGWDEAATLTFMFKRENGGWKLDDLKFTDGDTLRKSLVREIAEAK
jgi:Protein of unknown function (DUF3828)